MGTERAETRACCSGAENFREAEDWQAHRGDKEPKPRKLQDRYILASRKGYRTKPREASLFGKQL